ncbi:multiple ankyrin repeats single kh domain protein, putative [Cordyceps militaris CM01]|uniref:Multiple ankyrin repeats single kh domain protein, putative n=1 Tax=Cordyceps militaris (strain CM01) TaxID=983644 RepID=G3JSE7_CORMM|nr:multiple ankyrin repeats single kh domain protein, putative [Cordyceps militaris CM01]EGX88739.1 multiple ankyrin repeats single kh domain protein, putative [Cordyceps militaris CM01]
MSPFTPNERQKRILQLSSEWGVAIPPAPKALVKPLQTPTFQGPGDDDVAESLMQRRAADAAQLRPKGSLSRAFSTTNLKKGKHWDPREIVETLATHVANSGSPGVAEALIAKLSAAGVDLSGNQKQKSSLLSRRKSVDLLPDRARLLRLATESGSVDMVQVLVPHADALAIDASIPAAIRRADKEIAELLLKYGANVGETADGQDAFRQACTDNDRGAMIGMILNSAGRPSAVIISQAMGDASRSGCLDNVVQLSRSTGDGNYNHGEALITAVNMGRRDIALAIITGNKPPQPSSLNNAFITLYSHPSISPATKLDIGELLLCAGATGEAPALALEQACKSQFYDMVFLLSSYNVSIEYNEASALKYAISNGEMELVERLLNSTAPLNPQYASSCVGLIPKQASFEARYSLLIRLLHRGANGHALSQCLIDSVESGDLSSVDLLLNPRFPPQNNGASNGAGSPLNTHAVASTDYRSGEALRTAVIRADAHLSQKLLKARPSPQTITAVFPLTRKLPVQERHQIVSLFLEGSLSGDCLHGALQDALAPPQSQRDDSLIKQLLASGADINYNSGEGLVPLIKQMDLNLLALMGASISPQTAASRVPDAMKVPDHRSRFETLSILFNAGATIGVSEVASATLDTLSEKPVDMSLLRLLLETGSADINGCDGDIIAKAIENPDPKVLELVLFYGNPSVPSIIRGLDALAPKLSNDVKKWKFETIISKSTKTIELNRVLILEVKSIVEHATLQPSLDVLDLLLSYNADPNAFNAAALCHAVIAAEITTITHLVKSPVAMKPISLGIALPHALRIGDQAARLSTNRLLVEAGAPPAEINRALQHAIKIHPEDISLIELLSSKADTGDGDVLSLAVEKESPELISLLLKNSTSSSEARSTALTRAMDITTRNLRHDICKLLLASGVPADTASIALLVAARDGDVALGDLLMAHGANITSNNGQAIIEACRGGSIDVLKILLKPDGQTSKKTLNEAFQAATEVRDLDKRAVVFKYLLRCGASGEFIDAQLQSAARYGEPGESLLKVLLAAGADPNYNSGEAVTAATRSAFLRSLQLLLGLWDDGKSQKSPSQPTLVRALKASWNLNRDTRYAIAEDLFKAGLQPCEDLHMALNNAVNEEDPEERLVRLLLTNGASATSNSCKSLVDAVQNMASSCLSLMLQRDIAQKDINQAFNGAFTTETFKNWFSSSGLETAQLLLDKGASGDALSNSLLLVMQNSTAETSDLAHRFVDILVSHGADVNYNHGQPLQQAASVANIEWTRKLLGCKPTSETLSLAFQCIFDTALSQEEVLGLFKLFAEYRDGDAQIDVMVTLQGSEPVLVRAIKQYPRSSMILSTLLDAGYYHDQLTTCTLHTDVEEEEVTLLSWAISQPQKRVSTSVIELLVERGAKINVTSSLSGSTPLMLAVLNRRPDVVKLLLIEGAEVDVIDYLGRTPLAMATDMEGDVAVQIMSSILAAEPCRDDGSLHNAARELNLAAVKVLVQAGHDPDFPSPLHDGRSALGEVCLRAATDSDMPPERERLAQKVMGFLIDAGSDLAIGADGKPLLHLCFASHDPVATTRALLKAGMWKHINKPFNRCTDEHFTYSPTMYISKVMHSLFCRDALLAVLRASRAVDAFYATNGDVQPDDAVGLPDDMAAAERARRARLARLTHDTEEHTIALARRREIASVEQQIAGQKAEMEDARRRRQHNEDLAAVRARAQLEESIAATTLQRRLADQNAVTEAAMHRVGALAIAETDADDTRQRKAIEWEARVSKDRADNARAISAIRVSEREALEKVDRAAEQRLAKRIDAQRKLVDSQERLASRLANGAAVVAGVDQRRQIGYVTELN